MEKELVRLQSFIERTEHKTSRLWWVIIFTKMRQGSSCETLRTSSTINVLVSQTKHNLSQVCLWTLWLCSNHFINTIEIRWNSLRDDFLHIWQSVVKIQVDVEFKRIDNFFTTLMQIFICDFILISVLIQNSVVEGVNITDLLCNICLKLFIRNTICSSDSERVSH
jgi:hypothetical protein